MRFGFCGPTYASQSPTADGERCVNMYPETNESPGGKNALSLYPSPGLKLAYNLGSTAALGIFSCQPNGSAIDRLFAVVQSGPNQSLWELFSNGTQINRGSLTAPVSNPVSMVHNGTQLAICTGGQVWIFNLGTNVLTLQNPGNTIASIDYSDGFFVALIQNSNKTQLSALLDGTSWPGLSLAEISEFPDNVISMKVNQRGIWFLGRKATVPYYNAGSLNFPFLPVEGAFIEDGSAAPSAIAKLDNSLFWIDANERGGITGRRANGYTPQRVTNHGVEYLWQQYPKVSDAIGYAFEDQGHAFWHVYFPSGISVDGVAGAGASWRYDVATGLWHEVAYWNQVSGHYEAHHSQNHAYAWGNHYVGDWATGNIYQMSIAKLSGTVWSFADDIGNPIRRLRRGPTISTENEYFEIPQIEYDVEVGLGPQPPLTGPSQSPSQYIVTDANGNLWALTVSDAGVISVTELPAGSNATASAVILNDQVLAFASYQVSVIGGVAAVTALPQPGNYPESLPLATSGTGLQTGLQVQNGALSAIAPYPAARGPQLMHRHSKDNCKTWSPYTPLDCGQAGKGKTRVIKRRLGVARNFTAEVTFTDPVPLRLIDAYIPPANERLAKQIAKAT